VTKTPDNTNLRDFLLDLELLGPAGRQDHFASEVLANGGSHIRPSKNGLTSHMIEVSVHQVNAYGWTEDEAIRNWIKAATAVAKPAQDDAPAPFPTPRNHGEEIANARAAYRVNEHIGAISAHWPPATDHEKPARSS